MSRIDKCREPESRWLIDPDKGLIMGGEKWLVTSMVLMMYQKPLDDIFQIDGRHMNCMSIKIKELVVLITSRKKVYSRPKFSVAYILGDLTKKFIRCLKNACCRKYRRLDEKKNHKSQITQFRNLLETQKIICLNRMHISLLDMNNLHRTLSPLLLCVPWPVFT